MIAFGVAAAYSAMQLGRPRRLWFGFGAILGPLALALLRAAPPQYCRACGSATRGWLKECSWCGASVRDTSSKSRPMLPESVARAPSTRASPTRAGADLAQPFRLHDVHAPNVVAAPSPAPFRGDRPPAEVLTRELGTAIYVTGTTNLESGRRYAIAIRGSQLRILGPVDIEPSRIALDRPIAGMEARSIQGRLILGNQDGLMLSFMAVVGLPTQDLEAVIVEAARGQGQR